LNNQTSKKLFIGTVAAGIILIGLIIFWPKSPTNAFVDHLAQYDLFTDHHHQTPEPSLTINYKTGQKGSFFQITGINYPILNTAIITINGELIGTVPIDNSGSTIFQLRTTNSDNGVYFVTVTAAVDPPAYSTQPSTDPAAEIAFTINTEAPPRSSTGVEPTHIVPEGIATFYYIYLPVQYKE